MLAWELVVNGLVGREGHADNTGEGVWLGLEHAEARGHCTSGE